MKRYRWDPPEASVIFTDQNGAQAPFGLRCLLFLNSCGQRRWRQSLLVKIVITTPNIARLVSSTSSLASWIACGGAAPVVREGDELSVE